jgi:EAL domain-containing protein (putative c-di-GMP-specific phosphodiesterase class I)
LSIGRLGAIVALASSLGMEIVAEGVEDTDQLELLRQEGCDAYQGYLFSSAVAESELRDLLDYSLRQGQERIFEIPPFAQRPWATTAGAP